MSKAHRPKQTGKQTTAKATCSGGCGRAATTVIFDAEYVNATDMRPLLAMVLCDQCNQRRKRIEQIPYDECPEDDKAFMAQIIKPWQA